MSLVLEFWTDQEGQDLIEYSLLMVFIAIACLALLGNGQPSVHAIWDANANRLSQASTAAGGG